MKIVPLQVSDSMDDRQVTTLPAAKLHENGSLSLGQAAEVAGRSDCFTCRYFYRPTSGLVTESPVESCGPGTGASLAPYLRRGPLSPARQT